MCMCVCVCVNVVSINSAITTDISYFLQWELIIIAMVMVSQLFTAKYV